MKCVYQKKTFSILQHVTKRQYNGSGKLKKICLILLPFERFFCYPLLHFMSFDIFVPNIQTQ